MFRLRKHFRMASTCFSHSPWYVRKRPSAVEEVWEAIMQESKAAFSASHALLVRHVNTCVSKFLQALGELEFAFLHPRYARILVLQAVCSSSSAACEAPPKPNMLTRCQATRKQWTDDHHPW